LHPFLEGITTGHQGERATTWPPWRLRLRKTPLAGHPEAALPDWQRASPVFQS
jgi:hypothetical protein